MFGLHRRALLCLNPITIKPFYLLLQPSPSLLGFIYTATLTTSTSTSEENAFTFNYLITNCGFSPETASKLSNQVRLKNSDRPNSVLALFKTHGFSNAHISGIIKTYPKLLAFNPNKVIIPKLNFLLSKGASSSDLVKIITKNPALLLRSLENKITPCYDLVKKFTLSDEFTIYSIKYCPSVIYSTKPALNIQVLLENGVPESKVGVLLRNWSYSLVTPPSIFKKGVEEVKGFGIKPNTSVFIAALRAKVMSKSVWEKKIDLYKKWGWSEEIVVSAFVRNPWCMLASEGKIEAMMDFYVNHMGWDSLVLAKDPNLILLSLEKRIIPRAFVVQFLQSRGLLKDDKSIRRPFRVSEKMFLQEFVNPFDNEASQLLKLYEEKIDLSR